MDIQRQPPARDTTTFGELEHGDLFQWIEDVDHEGHTVLMKCFTDNVDVVVDIEDGEVCPLSDYSASDEDIVVKVAHTAKVQAR